MSTWYLYVVECNDGTLYTGITTDVERRVHEHNNTKKAARYTRNRRPVTLKAAWVCGDSRGAALRKERKFKRLRRRAKLKRIAQHLENDGEG